MAATSNIGRVIPIYRGAYSATQRYQSMDQVTYQNDLYMVKFRREPPIGTTPTNSSFWDPIYVIASQVKLYRDEIVDSLSAIEVITTSLREQVDTINGYYDDITTKHSDVQGYVSLINKKFIGVSPTPPTQDLNGDDLSEDNIGAWYYNSADNYGYTWTGTDWENLTKSANYDASKLTGKLPVGVLPFSVGTFGKSVVATELRDDFLSTVGMRYIDLLARPSTVSALGISDFSETVQDIVGALITSGSNINVTYSDDNNRLTVSNTATANTTPFTPAAGIAANNIQSALVELSNKLTTVVNSDAGKMTKTTYDPDNKQINVYNRNNHTGTQAISTIASLETTLAAKASRDIVISTSGLADGGGNLQANVTISVPVASNSQAVDGSSNVVAMTPATTKAAILSYITTSTNRNLSAFPLGQEILVADLSGAARNSVVSNIRCSNDDAEEFVNGGSGTLLSGIWQARGRSFGGTICERTM